MNSIYEMLTSCVHGGLPFNIDFEKRNMKLNGLYLIKNGEWDSKRQLLPESLQNCDILKTVENLYENFKYSLPSERSDNKRKKYFKALPVEEINDAVLFSAERREVAQAKLEGFVLCAILNGNFVWDEFTMGKWFWQSKNDSDLVIIRSWIENKNN